MATRKQTEYIQGHATHRRTEGDYMGVLLDAVTLDDWRGVATGALQAAKGGDQQARNWLAQYLIGRPEGKAPTPLNIVVQQLNGADPLVDRLARPLINQHSFPSLHTNDAYEAHIRSLVAAELAEKMKQVQTIENPASMRVADDLTANKCAIYPKLA